MCMYWILAQGLTTFQMTASGCWRKPDDRFSIIQYGFEWWNWKPEHIYVEAETTSEKRDGDDFEERPIKRICKDKETTADLQNPILRNGGKGKGKEAKKQMTIKNMSSLR